MKTLNKIVYKRVFSALALGFNLASGAYAFNADPALVKKYQEMMADKTELDLEGHHDGELIEPSIDPEEVKAVAEALKTNSTLTTLDLYLNDIEAEGAQAIAEALKTNRTLTNLTLGWNNIMDEGAQAIAEALKTNRTLTNLTLGWNNIMDEGARAIAEALMSNNTLKNLDLQRNNIKAEGAQAIAEALKTNSTLTTLDLNGNEIGQDLINLINQQLERNKKIPELWNMIKSFAPALLLPYQGSAFDVLVPDVKLKILQDLVKLHLKS